MIIAFEGIDCSFKETNSKATSKYFEDRGFNVNYITFPNYELNSGKKIKSYLLGHSNLTQLNCFLLQEANKVTDMNNNQIWNMNTKGKKVTIIDRYRMSNQAYMYNIKELDEDIFNSNRYHLPDPDIIIYIDMDPDISNKLLYKRAKEQNIEVDLNESDTEFQKWVRNNYLKLLKESKSKVLIVKAYDDNGIRSKEDIFNDIKSYLDTEVE